MTPFEQQAVSFAQSVAMRFVKGGVAGMVSALAVITIQTPTTWTALSTVLVALVYAAVVGFFTGGFLAVEKWYNWTTPTA